MKNIPKSLLLLLLALRSLSLAAESADQPMVPGRKVTVEKRRLASVAALGDSTALRITAPNATRAHKLIPRMSKDPVAINSPWAVTAAESPPVVPAAVLASPGSSTGFAALADDDTVIPPDTMGAVGLDYVVTLLNGQMRVQTRSGSVIKTTTLNAFWAFLNNPDAFDPRILYDPINNRWIATAVANAETPTSALLMAVSNTSDPTGGWSGARFPASENGFTWTDFPSVGFNRTYVVATGNLFQGNKFKYVKILAINKADLYDVNSTTFSYSKFQIH